ncbi:cytochrome [Bacillus pseudomycoides]|nr:cytochrome [Bacillus pseudomycoides]
MEYGTIKKIIEDRYKFYTNALNTEKITWDKELNAWLVFDYSTIVQFLKDSRLKANRKKQFIENLDIPVEYKDKLSSFYSRWLMYMDNPEHKELRKHVQPPINLTNSIVEDLAKTSTLKILNSLEKDEEIIDLINQIAIPFTENTLANLLGLSVQDYKLILQEAFKAVDFLWIPLPSLEDSQRTVHSIDQTYSIISEIRDQQRYEKNGLFDLILKNVNHVEDSLALIVNITVDGHEPFLSAVKTLMYLYIQKQNHRLSNDNPYNLLTIENIVEESLRLECPFPYCARVADEDISLGNTFINKGDRIILFISSGNRDQSKYRNPNECQKRLNSPPILSFGVGSHYCAGANLTRKSLKTFLNTIIPFIEDKSLIIDHLEWNDTFGFRTISTLKVKIQTNHMVTV